MAKKLIKALKDHLSYCRRKIRFLKNCWLYPVDEKLVVFEVFNGRSFSDSPRAIYEEMLQDPAYNDFKFIWIFKNPQNFQDLFEGNERVTLVKKNTSKYYQAYASAKYWVYNAGIAGVLHPRKGQSYIETWHGTPLKRICCDIIYDNYPLRDLKSMHKRYRSISKKIAYMPSLSDFYEEKITSAFLLDEVGKENVFIKTGYPRNSRLYSSQQEDIPAIKATLNIPTDKKIILYAPTWRNTEYVDSLGFVYQKSFDISAFLRQMGDDYIILFRLHYLQQINPDELTDSRVFDVSNVHDINDLYLISDMLITDYSSTMFDYAILKRPMLFYMYDRNTYVNEQTGIYFDLEELPGPIVQSEALLASEVLNLFNHFSYDEKYKKFNAKFNQYGDENAAKNLLQLCMPSTGDTNLTFPQRMNKNALLKFIYIPGHAVNLLLKKVYLGCAKLYQTAKRLSVKGLRFIYYNFTGFFKFYGLCLSKNSKKLYSYKNKYPKKRCFIIGNGPSLTVSDLELLKDEYTFGCNMLFRLFDQTDWRPSFYCVSDSNYAKNAGQDLADNVHEQVFILRDAYKKMKQKPKNLIYVNDIFREEHYKMRGNPMAYCMVKATVLTLIIEVAAFMGFEEMYLIGVDCTNPHASNGHFTANYVDKSIVNMELKRISNRLKINNITVDTAGQHIVNRTIAVYEKIKHYMDKKKTFTIYNATRGGDLEVFERRDLDEVLRS